MSQSLAQKIAALPPEQQQEMLAGLDKDELLWDWSFWGRPEQQTPPGDWNIHVILAGRGFGKTRTINEFLREEARETRNGKKSIGIVTRVAADGRDVIVDGPAGILSICPPSERPLYEPSKRRITWDNGNTATLYSADEPSLLRGPQFHVSVGDELAAWRRLPDDSGLTAFDNLRIATRLGDRPKMLLATTPKRVPVLYSLIKESQEHPDRVIITRGSTYDNAGNLSTPYLESLNGFYVGTHIDRQELYGEMLDAMEGALWNDQLLEDARGEAPIYAPIRVVGVDPSMAENPTDECGIVVCSSTSEFDLYKRRAWVLEDASLRGAPDVWAKRVVDMARKYQAPVVAEVNQGGRLVANAIHTIDPQIKVYEVHSKEGKKLRAEPVMMAYEQGRVTHSELADLVELETQMVTWIPETSPKSPDRIDALVHALTALMIKAPPGLSGGRITAHSVADRKIPMNRMTAPTRGAGRFRVR